VAITAGDGHSSVPADRPRRRRTPAQARAEILVAARELLEERPSQEVTVVAIMERTTLSRKSFYVYFRDRGDLFASLVEPLRVDADETLLRWREATDIVTAGRVALRSAALLYARHGTILRALARASDSDQEAARVWREVVGSVIDVATQKIAEATALGDSKGLDPQRVARALVTMNVHYLLEELVGRPDPDIDAAVATLSTIWERTIYLRDVAT
jgi:AcrR family transcriptional regulator